MVQLVKKEEIQTRKSNTTYLLEDNEKGKLEERIMQKTKPLDQ